LFEKVKAREEPKNQTHVFLVSLFLEET
jgi:hypothetical protein